MYITGLKKRRKTMKKQSTKKYIKCEVSCRELWECQFTCFYCKLYFDLFFFFTSKNCKFNGILQ